MHVQVLSFILHPLSFVLCPPLCAVPYFPSASTRASKQKRVHNLTPACRVRTPLSIHVAFPVLHLATATKIRRVLGWARTGLLWTGWMDG